MVEEIISDQQSFEPERAVEIIEAGAEPLKDLIAALHTILTIEEVERRR
ncbi:MAG: hypothetical protein M9938_04230 [Solirubrobacterales bacterium]|nr:hypothetical protein [Solirubrobacterales bacterium]